MSTTDTTKTRTITLTGRPPVRIVENDWPVIAAAMAKEWDNAHEFQANRTTSASIRVRQNRDGRTLVYAIYDYSTNFQGAADRSAKAGELLPSGESAADCIIRVAEEMDSAIGDDHFGVTFSLLARECIADLPAEEI